MRFTVSFRRCGKSSINTAAIWRACEKIAAKSGMWNLRASGWRKVLGGQTTAEEVLSVTIQE